MNILVATYLTDSQESNEIADKIKKGLLYLKVKAKVTVSSEKFVKVYTNSKRNIKNVQKSLKTIEINLGI